MDKASSSIPEYSENQFLSGDEKAFAYFFRKYYSLLAGFSAVFVINPSEAEDIVQEVFVTVWNKRSAIQIQGSLKHYLLTAVRNKSIDHIRAGKKNPTVRLDESIDPVSDFQDHLSLRQTGKKYEDAIRALSPQCRLVFVLCRFEGFSYQEAADLMQISRKTVENHMGRALGILRSVLREDKSGMPLLAALLLLPELVFEKLIS